MTLFIVFYTLETRSVHLPHTHTSHVIVVTDLTLVLTAVKALLHDVEWTPLLLLQLLLMVDPMPSTLLPTDAHASVMVQLALQSAVREQVALNVASRSLTAVSTEVHLVLQLGVVL